jgi:multiple sugar transport system permease protein
MLSTHPQAFETLGSTIVMVSALTMVGYFQVFAEPYVMTEGGPMQSTVSVLYFMYEQGFKWWNIGSASAIAFMLFLLMFLITLLQIKFTRFGEEQ